MIPPARRFAADVFPLGLSVKKDTITEMENDSKKALELIKEVEELRAKTSEKLQEANEYLAKAKEKYNDLRQTIRNSVTQEQWIRYGLQDKR